MEDIKPDYLNCIKCGHDKHPDMFYNSKNRTYRNKKDIWCSECRRANSKARTKLLKERKKKDDGLDDSYLYF